MAFGRELNPCIVRQQGWSACWQRRFLVSPGWNHPRPQLDSMAGLYDKAQVVYKLDASQLCEPMAMARIEGQLVAYEERSTAPVPNSAVGLFPR